MPKLNHLLHPTWPAPGATALDTATATGGALLLWYGGGTTVADAPWQTYILIILGSALLLATRSILRRNTTTRQLRPQYAITALIEVILLAATTWWWLTDASYLTGWIVTYASAFLFVSGIADVYTAVGRTNMRRRPRLRHWIIDYAHIGQCLFAAAGIAFTAPIHQWRLTVLDTTLLTIAGAIGLGIAGAWFLTSRVQQEPSRDTRPIPTVRSRSATAQQHGISR